MTALYSEIDPYAAQWLRNLIDADLIAPGVVDESGIENLEPAYVRQFTQVHHCAGIGVWSLALRSVGWPDARPVWTGSFPCQPFSEAGKGLGFADERHIWPYGFHLATQCAPAVFFGEQSASPAGMVWLDLVQNDMEALGYSFGAVPFPSAGVGAPHIRDRTYWVADSVGHGSQGRLSGRSGTGREAIDGSAGRSGAAVGLADAYDTERRADPARGHDCDRADAGWPQSAGDAEGRGELIGLADLPSCGRRKERADAGRLPIGNSAQGLAAGPSAGGELERPGPVNGFWRNADWLHCRDERWRPVEPETFPLVDGASNRAGRLRAYGNAINLEAAKAFILATGLV